MITMSKRRDFLKNLGFSTAVSSAESSLRKQPSLPVEGETKWISCDIELPNSTRDVWVYVPEVEHTGKGWYRHEEQKWDISYGSAVVSHWAEIIKPTPPGRPTVTTEVDEEEDGCMMANLNDASGCIYPECGCNMDAPPPQRPFRDDGTPNIETPVTDETDYQAEADKLYPINIQDYEDGSYDINESARAAHVRARQMGDGKLMELIERAKTLLKTHDDAGLRTCIGIATELLNRKP